MREETMRVGLWSFAHLHAQSYAAALRRMSGVEFVGVADEDAARGAEMAAKYETPLFHDADALLGDVDAVVITSANADHAAMALRAAQAGVAALVEKPLATTVADAQAMIEAFEQRGLTLATAFPCPFSPAWEELLQRAQDGELGDILAINATNRGAMPGGFFIQLERSGGGAVIDHTVHVADLLRRLLASEPREVYAEIGHGLYHQEWDDSGILSMTFADGAFATLDCSWSRPKGFPTWGDVTLRVIGARGIAYADLFNQHIHLYHAEERPSRWQGWGADLDALMLADFVAAVRDRRPPRSSGWDGLHALRVALAAYQSAREGQPVPLEVVGSLKKG